MRRSTMRRSTKYPFALLAVGAGLLVWSMGCGEQADELEPVAPNGTTGAPDATGTLEDQDPAAPNGSYDPNGMNRTDPAQPGIPGEPGTQPGTQPGAQPGTEDDPLFPNTPAPADPDAAPETPQAETPQDPDEADQPSETLPNGDDASAEGGLSIDEVSPSTLPE